MPINKLFKYEKASLVGTQEIKFNTTCNMLQYVCFVHLCHCYVAIIFLQTHFHIDLVGKCSSGTVGDVKQQM